ncbi:hypothetical protein Taro_036664 [Colocasia esculenta]|uniref:Uncharacterized protein n=1 Tax=Colocasia esculenta TaxID=4460 RepID=A0A843WE08_COLES|nr:hypothetical protein [Colocasia esculenta]
MLRRKPSKIEVKVEDREELEEALRSRHQRATTATITGNPSTAATASSSATSLLQSLLLKKPALDPAEKAHLLGIPQNP